MTTRRRIQSTPAADRAMQATPLLTDKQVMELLKVSRTGLHYLMRRKGFPYVKLGESRRAPLRFSQQSVQEWLAQNEHRITA